MDLSPQPLRDELLNRPTQLFPKGEVDAMTTYVIYDPMIQSYLKGPGGKDGPAADWREAKQYKRLKNAVDPSCSAGLHNGLRYKRNQPFVEVHEYDKSGAFVQTHEAPPLLIELFII